MGEVVPEVRVIRMNLKDQDVQAAVAQALGK
jgi:hypothetical protein